MNNIYLNIFLLFLVINLLVTGGRIASSDEVATYLLVESIVTRGSVDIPQGIVGNGSEHNGKFYVWYEIGQALTAVPLYLAGSAVATIIHLPDHLRTLFLKAVMGTYNAFIGALYACLIFAFGKRLGYSARLSFFLSASLCLTTFAFPYFKTFLREPLFALLLLAVCYSLERWRTDPSSSRWMLFAGLFTGLGMFMKVAFLLHMPVFILFIIYILRGKEHHVKAVLRSLFMMALPMVPFLIGVLWYNYARFQDPFDLGYETVGIRFNIPFYTGLFGLLLSPGKGFFFFAPLAIAGSAGLVRLVKQRHPAALLWTGIIVTNLLFYCTYFAWGGDGSWGPRFILALLPFVILPAGVLLQEGKRWWKRTVYALVVAGFVIQLGGITIYAGTYIREIGEFPFTRSFYDPEFLYKTHFIPDYSPLVGHWKMALRNIKEHLEGHQPNLVLQEEQSAQRIPVEGDARVALGHTLDYWFCYPSYVGIHSVLFVIAPFLLLTIVLIQWMRVRRLVLASGGKGVAIRDGTTKP